MVEKQCEQKLFKKMCDGIKGKKFWFKGRLRQDQIVGMSGGFCIGNTISNNFKKGGKRFKHNKSL